MRSTLRVTVVGGGNGISAVLRGLARESREGRALEISAVVATADDGGSSGRIRRERGGLPVGDFRNCLLALAPDPSPLAKLFAHRYLGTGELAGHAVGNLMLAALAEQEGCHLRGLEVAGRLLGCAGRVLPATTVPLALHAELEDGSLLNGESSIGRSERSVRRVWLEPSDASAPEESVSAIREADLLVIGPGSLYTSLLSVLCVGDLARALRETAAIRVLVSNLMTQPGETSGMRLNAHLDAIDAHLGAGMVDAVLAHGPAVEPWRLAPYAAEGSEPVLEPLRSGRRERLVVAELATGSGKIRHDAARTAAAVLALAPSPKTSRAAKPSVVASTIRQEVTSR
ncbi:MAG TPA: uridine diphosphate-N-acetylglucosamine-binding protein YvcK [Candidatus Polarisedimenticolaceae bacterium]